jgi:parvulin-like peptidyl-prolyl isomerase
VRIAGWTAHPALAAGRPPEGRAMKWHCLVASAAVFGVVAGCQADRPGLAGDLAPAAGVARSAAASPVERLQKPDGDGIRPASFTGFLQKQPEPLAEKGNGAVVAAIRATVNGVPILDQEVVAASLPMLQEANGLAEPERSQRMREIKNKVLESLIERELILQDAKNRFSKGPGAKFLDKLKEAAEKEFDRQVVRKAKAAYNLKTDDDLKKFLAGQGLSLESLRRNIQRQFITQQYLQFLLGPKLDRIGHEDIEAYFRGHPEEFQQRDKVQWQDIFIAAGRFPSREAARQFAEGLRARAKAGEDFAAMARQHDMGTSSYQGGEGIGHQRGEIRPREVEPALFAMRDGEVGELVELESGFHIVRLVKRQYAGQMPFSESTQESIRDKLKNEVFTREAKGVVADMLLRATVEKVKY